MAQTTKPDHVRDTLATAVLVKVRVSVSTRRVRPGWQTIGMSELSECLTPAATIKAGGREFTVGLRAPSGNRFSEWSQVILKAMFPPPGKRVRNGALKHANRKSPMQLLQNAILTKYRRQLKQAMQDPALYDRIVKVRDSRQKQEAARTVAEAFAGAVNVLSTEEVAELWKQSIVGSVISS